MKMKTLIAGLLLSTALATAQTPASLPPLPALPTGQGIKWDAPTNVVTGHMVYWGDTAGVWKTNFTVLAPTNQFTLPFRQPGTNYLAVVAFVRQPDSTGSTNLVDVVSDLSEIVTFLVPQPPKKLMLSIVVEASASPAGPFVPVGSVETEIAMSDARQFFRAHFNPPTVNSAKPLQP